MKYKLLILLLAILLVGCDSGLKVNSKPSEERLAQMEKRRTNLREEIKRLTIEKKKLEEDPPIVTNTVNVITNVINVITNVSHITTNITQVTTNVIVVTNFVSSFDVTPDGRIGQRVLLTKVFNTDEVVSLPYSPHEFIVRSNNVIYHASFNFGITDKTNILAFKLFK